MITLLEVIASPLIEYAVGIGIDSVKDKVKSNIEEKEIEKRLYQLFESKSDLQLELTEQELKEFPILIQYIKDELMEDIKIRLFDGNRNERTDARERIISNVISFTEEHPAISENNAKKFVRSVIDMLRKFFRKKVNRDILIAVAEIEDSVEEIICDDGEKTRKLISEKAQELKSVMGENQLSIESTINLAKAGEFDKINDQYGTWNKALSSTHELYPYYGYSFNEKNQIYSRPLSKEATALYPPRINIEPESIKLNGEPVPCLSDDILKKAYRHQYQITFNVRTAKKMLGNIMDPIQKEAQSLEGAQVIAKPQKFPPAVPCSILINHEVAIPYLLLGLIEILDDDTYILTNDEQINPAFFVKIIMNFEQETLKFSIKPNSPSTNEMLNCLKFYEKIQSKITIALKILEFNENVFEAECQFNGKIKEIESLQDYIALYERIVKIEEWFSCKFNLPELPGREDIESVYYLYSLFTTGVMGTWKDLLKAQGAISEQLKANIDLLRSRNSITICWTQELSIFKKIIEVPICSTFESAVLNDSDKIKKKLEVCDLGEVINITFSPGEKDGIGKYRAVIDKSRMGEIHKA